VALHTRFGIVTEIGRALGIMHRAGADAGQQPKRAGQNKKRKIEASRESF
jgi:hypothetical protein